MTIQLFRPVIPEEAIQRVVKVLRSGWIGLGPEVAEFERHFCSIIGSRYAVALNSCTSALHLALVALNIGPGDEVITTPQTFVSTNHAIKYVGATPVFADINPDTGCIDPSSVLSLINSYTKAIMAVHFGGWPCDMDALRKTGIPIIEDCAHAFGTRVSGVSVGQHLGCFSFHAVKNLPLGDGGMLTTDDEDMDARLRRLRWCGIDKDTYKRTTEVPGEYAWKYDVPEVGFKYHMNDISAALGNAQIASVEGFNARRREIARYYDSHINNSRVIAKCPISNATVTSAQHLYWLYVDDRDGFIMRLKKDGIEPGVHYVSNNTFAPYLWERGRTPEAHWVSRMIVSLPINLYMMDCDMERVVEVINGNW